MEARSLLRPLRSLAGGPHAAATTRASASAATATPTATARVTTTRRHQSTTARTKRMLRVPPHPTFLTPKLGPDEEDVITFNPPASVPSVYHTPLKFLPPTDPRRQASLAQMVRSATSAAAAAAATAAGRVENPNAPIAGGTPAFVPPRRTVSREQVEEMRQLRAEDSVKWSVAALAKKFDCTNYFVTMCCKAAPEHKKSEMERLEAIKARWGPIRRQARTEREHRKWLLHRDEL